MFIRNGCSVALRKLCYDNTHSSGFYCASSLSLSLCLASLCTCMYMCVHMYVGLYGESSLLPPNSNLMDMCSCSVIIAHVNICLKI